MSTPTSRRDFLGASAALLGAAALPRGAAASPAPGQQESLPPAIAALTSQRDRMVPITREERAGRLAKASELMGRQGLDALVLTGGTSLRYFTNIGWGLSERFFGMLIPAKGDSFFVCPAFELDRAQEQVKLGPYAGRADVRIWHEDESPYALVAQGLKSLGVATGTLGIEETVRFVFSDGVFQQLFLKPRALFISFSKTV